MSYPYPPQYPPQYPPPYPTQSNNRALMFGGVIVVIIICVLMYTNITSDTSKNPVSTPSSSPSTGSPSTGSPSTGSPSTGSPSTGSPSNGTSSIQSVDCEGDWQICSKPCGDGEEIYKITIPKKGEGKSCPEVDGKSKPCKIKDCPVDCIGNWIEPCSAPCGEGTQRYKITTQKKGDGINCPVGDGASKTCKIMDCPPPPPPAPPPPPPSSWPGYSAPFSIKLRNTNMCLHPEGGSDNPNENTRLVLWEGCNEERLKYRVFPGGGMQHLKGGKCLWPEYSGGINQTINFKTGCDASQSQQVAHIYENGKIKNINSGLCFKEDGIGNGWAIRLQNCGSASVFDLV